MLDASNTCLHTMDDKNVCQCRDSKPSIMQMWYQLHLLLMGDTIIYSKISQEMWCLERFGSKASIHFKLTTIVTSSAIARVLSLFKPHKSHNFIIKNNQDIIQFFANSSTLISQVYIKVLVNFYVPCEQVQTLEETEGNFPDWNCWSALI